MRVQFWARIPCLKLASFFGAAGPIFSEFSVGIPRPKSASRLQCFRAETRKLCAGVASKSIDCCHTAGQGHRHMQGASQARGGILVRPACNAGHARYFLNLCDQNLTQLRHCCGAPPCVTFVSAHVPRRQKWNASQFHLLHALASRSALVVKQSLTRSDLVATIRY